MYLVPTEPLVQAYSEAVLWLELSTSTNWCKPNYFPQDYNANKFKNLYMQRKILWALSANRAHQAKVYQTSL